MKILFVTSLFPSPVDPLHGVFKKQLAKSLSENNEVVVLRPVPYFPKFISRLFKNSSWVKYSIIPKEFNADGLKVFTSRYYWFPGLSARFHPFFMRLGIKKEISRLNHIYNFDVINTHWLHPDAVAVSYIAGILNIPHVPTACGSDVNKNFMRPERIQRANQIVRALNCSKHITVVAQELKNLMLSNSVSCRNIHVIPNGVDKSKFFPESKIDCRNQLSIKLDFKAVLYVGRLSEEKNLETLVRAFSLVSSTVNKSILYLVGKGAEEKNLLALVNDLKLDKHVIFVGNVDHLLIRKWIGAADCFCLPSKHEGCPNVVLEALSSGRPVVGSYAGAIPDLVSEDTGILFNATDVDELAKALSDALIRNWDYQLIADSMEEYTWNNTAHKYLSVFEEAISDNCNTTK